MTTVPLGPVHWSWQSLGVWVPARPPGMGVTVHHVSTYCRSAKGPAMVQVPLPSSEGEGRSELWPSYRCSDPSPHHLRQVLLLPSGFENMKENVFLT